MEDIISIHSGATRESYSDSVQGANSQPVKKEDVVDSDSIIARRAAVLGIKLDGEDNKVSDKWDRFLMG